MGLKTSGTVGHWQLVRVVNFFSSGFEKTRENLEIKILGVLHRLGADGISENAGTVTVVSDGTMPYTTLPRAVEMSRSLE